MTTIRDLGADEKISELLAYDPDTGILTWKERPARLFNAGFRTREHSAAIWNAKNAGRPFGRITANGYLRGTVLGRKVMAHRLAWGIVHGVAPDGEIDHINGIRHDNRIANLREADRQGNCRNRAAVAGSTSKHIGVSWNSKMMMWRAQISVDGKNTHLGYFVSEADAAAAYRTAAKSHYGEFHRHEIGEVNAPANH